MYLNIEPILNVLYMECYESALASVANYYRKGFTMIFLNTWNFSYTSKSDTGMKLMGERIQINGWNIEQLLEEYYGVSVVEKTDITSEEIFETVIHQLTAGYPALVRFDQYYSPWASELEKENKRYSGFYMIVGFDHFLEQFDCLDIYYSKRIEKLPFKSFINGVIGDQCTTFKLLETAYECIDITKVLNSIFLNIHFMDNERNAFDEMRILAKDISDIPDFFAEFNNENDINNAPMMKNIASIFRGRGLFSITLSFLGHTFNSDEIVSYAKEMEKIAAEWYKVKGVMCKALYLKSKDLIEKRIPEYIVEIAAREERIAAGLLNFFSSVTWRNQQKLTKEKG